MNEQSRRKILVVDDEITVCKSIRNAILSEECRVDTALSGEEALKKDEEETYDLVITDLMMPGISGLDLLSALKERRPEVNLIMVTGYPTLKTAVQSIKSGAFDYIPKPFTPDQLRNLVARVFRKMESEEKAGKKPLPLRMPAGLHTMIGHTWLRQEENGLVTVGVVHEFLQPVGIVTHLELPRENDTVSQGEECARIIDAENLTHRIWSPVSGRVVEVNLKLKKDYSLLRKDPYQQGWLFRVEPTNLDEDLKGLVLSR